MGRAREAIALYLKGRDRAISYYRLSHLKYIAAMAAGSAYQNSQDLIDKSTEGFKELLYNKESEKPKAVETPEDVKSLWNEIIGEPWPESSGEPDESPFEEQA